MAEIKSSQKLAETAFAQLAKSLRALTEAKPGTERKVVAEALASAKKVQQAVADFEKTLNFASPAADKDPSMTGAVIGLAAFREKIEEVNSLATQLGTLQKTFDDLDHAPKKNAVTGRPTFIQSQIV
jgi:hypothetical protein